MFKKAFSLKVNDLAECFRIKACASHQCSVNIRHGHQLSNIVRFDATPIQYPDGTGKIFVKNLFQQRP